MPGPVLDQICTAGWAWVARTQDDGSTAPLRSLPSKYSLLASLQGALLLLLLSTLPVIPFIYPLSCKQINMPIPWDTWLSLHLRLAILVCALDIDFHCLSYHSTKGHLIAVSFRLGERGRITFTSPLIDGSHYHLLAQCGLIRSSIYMWSSLPHKWIRFAATLTWTTLETKSSHEMNL